jgi:hypothetical protein
MRMSFAAAALVVAAACGTQASDKPAAAKQAADSTQFPRFALADFQKIGWLEGAWRGKLPNGNMFFESYQHLDDSTIAMRAHTDSSLETTSDSALVTYRAGRIAHRNPTHVWWAASIDSNSVDFVSPLDRRNHFVWTRQDARTWKATIYSVAPDGTVRTTIYTMEQAR